jgi:hypothetical protein
MSLREVKTTDFNARIDRDLAKLGLSTEAGREGLDLGSLTDQQKHRAEFLLDRRERLAALFSPQVQIDAFDKAYNSPGLWTRSFLRLGEITTSQNTGLEGQKLQRHIWDSLQGRDVREFKRFQEIFSEPQHFVVPRFNIAPGKGSRVFFDPNARVVCSSVLGTLVVPDRISLNLCEHLNLYQPLDDKGDPWARLLARADLKVLQAIKLIWDASVPFSGSGRVRVISQPQSRVASRYAPFAVAVDSRAEGRILISHEVPGDAGSAWVRRGIQFFQDPHGSMRRAQHIELQYEKEVGRTRQIEVKLRLLSSRVDLEWRGANQELRAVLVGESKEAIGEALNFLDGARDGHKQKAKDLLAAAYSFRDSKDRVNPSVVLVRVANAMKALGERLGETHAKGSFVHKDGQIAHDEIARASAAIRLLGDKISHQVAPMLPGLALFSERTSAQDRATQAKHALSRFGINPAGYCVSVQSPYASIQQKLIGNYAAFAAAVAQGNIGGASEALVRMHIVVKYHEVYQTIEKMKEELPSFEAKLKRGTATASAAVLDELLARATYIKVIFNERQILPEHEVAESYSRPFMELRTRLQTIERGLRHYRDSQASADEVRGMLSRFKQYLEQYSVAQSLDQLNA